MVVDVQFFLASRILIVISLIYRVSAHINILRKLCNNYRRLGTKIMVMAEGDKREVGFQDGGCFSRFLKRERINNQTFIAFLKLTLTLKLTTIT